MSESPNVWSTPQAIKSAHMRGTTHGHSFVLAALSGDVWLHISVAQEGDLADWVQYEKRDVIEWCELLLKMARQK